MQIQSSGWVRHCGRWVLGAAFIAMPLAGAGCYGHYHERYHERVYVDVAPPPDRVEVIPVRPGPDFYWIHGHHVWRDGRYVWVEGRYERGGHRDGVYVRGHWANEHGRYYWVEGRWE